MNTKAMQSTIIYAVIAVVFLAVTAFFVTKSYSTLYSGFKDWNTMSETEQKDIKNNFQEFTDKIKECKDIKDSFCKCENIFPNFPNSFREEVSLDVLQESVNFYISLKYNKNEIEGAKTDMGRGRLFFVSESGKTIQEIRKGEAKLEITFDKNYPEVIGIDEEKYKIVSRNIFRRDFKNILYFIVDNKEFFDEFPKCLDNRIDAINLFDSLIKNLKKEKEIKVSLPEGYRIHYGNKFFRLRHENGEIGRIYDKNMNKLEKMENVIEIYDYNVKCNNPLELDYLYEGDKIRVNKIENGFCIEKIIP